MKKDYITWDEVFKRLKPIDKKENIIYGIPYEGMIVSSFLKNAKVTASPEKANIILDVVIASGLTEFRWKDIYKDKEFYGLIDTKHRDEDKKYGDYYVVFPWDDKEVNHDENHAIKLLKHHNKTVTTKNVKKLIKIIVDNF